MELDNLTLRELQKECARALSTMDSTSAGLSQFNKQAHHDSLNWYKAVIKNYIETHGGLPSKIGPGKTVRLVDEKNR